MSEDAIKLYVYSLPKMISTYTYISPVADYFTAIRKNECVKMSFKVSKDFAEAYKVAEYTEFTNHSDLKELVEHLLVCNPWFAKGYPYECQLLRSFDISFCLFDPKNVESSPFKDIKHVTEDIITNSVQ